MKRIALFSLLGVLVTGMLAMASPLSLCDYHSPETSITNLKLSMNYRYFDNPATTGTDVSSGRVMLAYNQLYDSPDFGFTLAGSGEVNLADWKLDSVLGQGAGTLRYYLTQDLPVFGFGGINGTIATGQSNPGLSLGGANVSLGLGYGRFSDVTPLAKAFTIQKDLLALGAISKPLPDDVLMSVAKEIGRQVEYKTIKDLVAAVEKLIEDSSGATLDARALLTVEDDILATGDERNCGWAVQGGLGYELIDPTGGTQDLLLTFSTDAAFAPEPGSQLLCHASFYGPFDILQENTFTMTTSYDYSISEQTSLLITYNLQRMQPLQEETSESQSLSLSLSFNVGGADISLQVGSIVKISFRIAQQTYRGADYGALFGYAGQGGEQRNTEDKVFA